jgi:hypothetical protein
MKKIVIKISKNIKLIDAIIQAMNSKNLELDTQKLHQSIKFSVNQDEFGSKMGKSSFRHGEWRSQIGIMLG